MDVDTTRSLGNEGVNQLADTFGLLADPTRLAIVLACRDGLSRPSQIAEALGVSASLVSHHLRLLRASRMVRSEREGRHILYTLDDVCVHDMLSLMVGHVLHHGDGDHDTRAASPPHEPKD
ncbi:MAG: metalloregulator ArsR/SmtB family transcription factor [Pseudomonadota bacterium]